MHNSIICTIHSKTGWVRKTANLYSTFHAPETLSNLFKGAQIVNARAGFELVGGG